MIDPSVDLRNLQRVWQKPLPQDYFADRDWYVDEKNIWILQVGSKAEYGSYEAFKQRVSGAKVTIDDSRIRIDLAAEAGGPRASGEVIVRAVPGRSLPPFTMRGAGGWVSGYVVPVMSGELAGTIAVGGELIDLSGGTGYHDHNWGFWEGVRWQWGQVEGEGLAFVYGRVFPPGYAADTARLPGFLVALGPGGPVGYTTDVTIEETDTPSSAEPRRIVVSGRGDFLTLTFDIAVDQITTTRMGAGSFGSGMDFLQLRGTYRASGRAGDRKIEFTAPGSAETFRGPLSFGQPWP